MGADLEFAFCVSVLIFFYVAFSRDDSGDR